VKEYLSQKKILYTEYDVAADMERAREMVNKTRQMGVPVIIADDEVVIGFNKPQLDKIFA